MAVRNINLRQSLKNLLDCGDIFVRTDAPYPVRYAVIRCKIIERLPFFRPRDYFTEAMGGGR